MRDGKQVPSASVQLRTSIWEIDCFGKVYPEASKATTLPKGRNIISKGL
jgi:hypothetical protein